MKILLLYGADYKLAWGRSQNMARAFAALGHEVMYVNHIKPASYTNIFNFIQKPSPIVKNLLLYPDIPGLPQARFSWLTILNAFLQPVYLWRILKFYQQYDLTIIYGVPPVPISLQTYFFRLLKGKIILYDCADDKVSLFRDQYSNKIASQVEKMETNLVQLVDAVTAINKHNLARLNLAPAMPCKVIGNGVDLELFKPLPSPRNTPPPPYKIVYIGRIDNQIDTDKILKLLQQNHSILEIHFYGKAHTTLEPLQNETNFFYHGYVPYEKLPKVLSGYHFGLLPYRDTQTIRLSFPLKILQYLACDLPVLAFYYREINTFGGRVYLIDDKLPEIIANLKVHNRNFLEEYSWRSMARQMINFIQTITVSSN